MTEDDGEATRVVRQIEGWFARAPFETVREEFLAAPDFETAARRMAEHRTREEALAALRPE